MKNLISLKDMNFVADNQSDVAYEVGTLKGVEEFLLQFAD